MGAKARDDVTLRRVGSEWVLFDARNDKAHILNQTAALVWTYCDGTRESDDMARAIAAELRDRSAEQILGDIEKVLARFTNEGLLL